MLRLAGRVQSARLAAVAARPAARGAAGVGLQLFAPAAGARTAAWARVSPACVQGARGYAADPEQKPTPKEQALAVQNSLTVVEKAEWEKKWKDFKESAYQSKIFERVASAGERVDDFIEDSDNFFVRQIRRAKHAFFTETEEALALAEIKRLDPNWQGVGAFTDWLEGDVLETWVGSYLRGDEAGIKFMQQYNTERAMMMCVQFFKQRQVVAPGCRLDDRVLMIEDVEYETATLMDDGQPILIVNFAAQGVECFWNADNECVHGSEDDIEKTYYRWAMQLDTIETEDEEGVVTESTAWKLAEWGVRAKIPMYA